MQQHIFLIQRNYQDNDDFLYYSSSELLTLNCYATQKDAEDAIKLLCVSVAKGWLKQFGYSVQTRKINHDLAQQNQISIRVGVTKTEIFPLYQVMPIPLFSSGVNKYLEEIGENPHILMDVSNELFVEKRVFGLEELKEVQKEYNVGLNSDGSCNVFHS